MIFVNKFCPDDVEKSSLSLSLSLVVRRVKKESKTTNLDLNLLLVDCVVHCPCLTSLSPLYNSSTIAREWRRSTQQDYII
mmetsp:Transcript_32238/g.78629  ORF Transcript_32238/g.78629 Transcript_32238/m.78629 type:complete len:80 (-) Transcript_32238:26-265(-)